MPEAMASKLTVLIILPAIMTACGAFSIVSSILIILTIVIGKLKKREVEEEEEDKEEIKYLSSLPVTEKDMIVNENIANSETEISRQKCMTVEFSTWSYYHHLFIQIIWKIVIRTVLIQRYFL